MLKKILILVGIVLVILVLALFTFVMLGKSKLEGRWKTTSAQEGCFSAISFYSGPPNFQGVAVHETEGNHTQVWFGDHKIKRDIVKVELTNPKADPFEMKFTRIDDELALQYQWKGQEYSCTYQNEGK